MKQSIIILIIFLFITDGISQTKLPSIAVKKTNGEVIKLSDLSSLNKPMIISFWATYCNPCLQEFEAVADLYAEWKKEVDFEFIAISIDDSRSAAKVKSFVSGKRWPFMVLIDENQDIKRAMNVTDIPFYFIFDSNGKYVFKHSGYLPGDEYIMLKELKKALNE
jgi:thiol-disulfide isomerase/thioredoxin